MRAAPSVTRSRRPKRPVSHGRQVRAFSERILDAARRDQSNYPEQNDRPDKGGEQAGYKASADHPEGHREEPAAQERADNPHDHISEHAVPMSAHHSPSQRSRDQPDQDEQDEVHGFLLRRMFIPTRYWMTSSARTSNDCGMVRPSAFAALRLTTSSNLVGCSIGKSAGLVPLRILSM